MALFGGSRGGQPKNLVEFRAGKMTMKGTTVSADKRKGLVYIYQSEDNLTHFCWKDRTSGTVEDDLILFPDDCEYKKVTQCKEGARVYLLKFKSSARKLFFWMQESKTDNDDDFVWKVNDALNNPGGSSSGRGNGGSLSATSSEQEMQALLSSMSQSQLMQLLGGMSDLGGGSGLLSQLANLGSPSASTGGSGSNATGSSNSGAPRTEVAASGGTSASAPKTDATKSSSSSKAVSSSSAQAIQLKDLQQILNTIQTPTSTVDLSGGVNNDLIQKIVSNPSTVKKLAPLLPNFGGPQVDSPSSASASSSDESPSSNDVKEVEDTLLSPQFHSALRAFCAAFPTGQLGPLIAQFDFGKAAVDAAQAGNLEAFVNAVQQEADNNETTSQTSTTATAGTDEPEDMNID